LSKEVQVRVIRQVVARSRSPTRFGAASGDIVGFHAARRACSRARKREKVEIRICDIIYKAVEEVKQALEACSARAEGSRAGTAEVREVFKLSKSVDRRLHDHERNDRPYGESVRLLRDGPQVWTAAWARCVASRTTYERSRTDSSAASARCMNDLKRRRHRGFTIEELARTL
jgi:hypothetical protein